MSNKRAEKIKEQLGMSQGTAVHRLRKNLMFAFAQRLGLDTCYACGNIIESAKELSIEHKEPWEGREGGEELFWSHDNIAFSHTSCNVVHSKGTTKVTCGDYAATAYRNGCRCDECKEAQSQKNKRRKR